MHEEVSAKLPGRVTVVLRRRKVTGDDLRPRLHALPVQKGLHLGPAPFVELRHLTLLLLRIQAIRRPRTLENFG